MKTQHSSRASHSLTMAALLVVTLLLALAPSIFAQAKPASDLHVAAMPSYGQNRAYANIDINVPLAVWGRAWSGTPPYSYDLDFGDGSAHLTGSTANGSYIGANHAYTTSGTKTMTLTVTDSSVPAQTYSRSAQIRVIVTPTHDERVNMAIEKGLVFLYKNQSALDATRVWWSGWVNWNHQYQQAVTGSAVMAFEENGHLPDSDYEEWIYAETVQKGLNLILNNGQGRANWNIPPHSDGIAVRNSDSNGNGYGSWLTNNSYANSYACMAVILSQRNAVDAQNKIVDAGPFAGRSYYEVIQDNFDQFSYNQGDGNIRGSWVYSISGSTGGRWDGSAQQWPSLAFKAGIDRWNLAPQQWVIDNTVHGFQHLQHPNGGGAYHVQYNWLNVAKTGGSLVGFSVGNKTVGDGNVDRAIQFISNNWFRTHDPGWAGDFYAMYGGKKGLAINDVTTLPAGTTAAGVDWYEDMSGWLLGPKSVATISPSLPGGGWRTTTYAYGQLGDGSWRQRGHMPNVPNFNTANAILILTKSLTKPLPVAVVEPVPDQSARFPAAFTLDGSNSFHSDPDSSIVEYLWILDAGPNPDWSSPDATGQIVSVNPGWDTESIHTATLRIKDDQDPANFATATVDIVVSLNDVAPVAVAIPSTMVPPVYTAKIGETIDLDGSESFDPEGDPLVSYAWDLDGNGTFGDAADAALDTSGNGAQGVIVGNDPSVITASVVYGVEFTGQIGLQVCSQPDLPGAPVLCSNNNAFIDVQVSPSDLFVVSISANNVVQGVSADLSAVLGSDAASGKDFAGTAQFYDGDPFGAGLPLGSPIAVTIPKGGSTAIGPVGLTLNATTELVYVLVDSGQNFSEFDETNNTASVNVSNQPPVAIAQDVTVSADADCLGTVTIDQINNESFDPDGDELTLSVSPVGPYPLGDTEVTLTVSDGKETATATATVTVVDDTPPVITCPDDIVVNNDPGECSAIVDYATPVATDNCPDPVTELTVGLASGSIFPVGTTTVTYLATDASGNTAECSFTVTVIDNEAPTITCPADVCVVSDADSCDASDVLIGLPTTSDNCPGETAANDHPSSTYPLGDTTVTWTVTDAAGNTATCTQTITVLASVAGTWRSPLAGQPVANKIRVGQVVPHKIDLADCTGVAMTDLSGITVTLQIVGVNAVTGDIFQEVVEDAQGVGVDGTLTSDGLMEFKDDHWHFNVDTGNFDDPDTAGSDNHYISTVTITDNATLKILGTSSVTLETAARGGGKKK